MKAKPETTATPTSSVCSVVSWLLTSSLRLGATAAFESLWLDLPLAEPAFTGTAWQTRRRRRAGATEQKNEAAFKFPLAVNETQTRNNGHANLPSVVLCCAACEVSCE